METICFSSFVFGAYQKYIPYYIYAIHRTYPNAYVKVIYEGVVDRNVRAALTDLKENNAHFEVLELPVDSFREYAHYPIRGGGKKLVRWLLNPELFTPYTYAYFGDVDILIFPEQEALMEFHKRQMAELKLPFSNKVRLDEGGAPVQRLTGLHFVKTKEYFDGIGGVISKIKGDEVFREQYLADVGRDENFLYKINKETFDFDDRVLSKAKRPWHGLHLGITRGNKNVDVKQIAENSSLSLEEIKAALAGYSKDPLFVSILRRVFVVELYVIMKELKLPMPYSYKVGKLKFYMNAYFYSLKRRLR